MNAEDVVTVSVVTNPLEAEMVANMLRGEGIVATVEGAGQPDIAGNTELRILVHAGDAARARKALKGERALGQTASRSPKHVAAARKPASGGQVTHASSPRGRRYGKGAS